MKLHTCLVIAAVLSCACSVAGIVQRDIPDDDSSGISDGNESDRRVAIDTVGSDAAIGEIDADISADIADSKTVLPSDSKVDNQNMLDSSDSLELALCLDDPSCDDTDPCTSDSCDPMTGCSHTPKCASDSVCFPNGSCCMPLVCGQWGAACGVAEDLCGGTLECGACAGGKECIDNVCTDGVCDFAEVASLAGKLVDIVKLETGYLAAVVAGGSSQLEVFDVGTDWMVTVELQFNEHNKVRMSSRGNELAILRKNTLGLAAPPHVSVFTIEGEQVALVTSFDLLPECILDGGPDGEFLFEMLPNSRVLVHCSGMVQAYDYSAPADVVLVKEWLASSTALLAVGSEFAYFLAMGKEPSSKLLRMVDQESLNVVEEVGFPTEKSSYLQESAGRIVVASGNALWARAIGSNEDWTERLFEPDYEFNGLVGHGEMLVASATIDGVNAEDGVLLPLDPITLEPKLPSLEMPSAMSALWADESSTVVSLQDTAIYTVPHASSKWADTSLIRSFPGHPRELIFNHNVLWTRAASQRLVAYDLRQPSTPVEVGEILLGDNSDLVIAGNTIFVTLTEGNFGWDITDPANPAYLGMFGSVISHAGWGNRYVTCTPEWLLDPGESVDLLFYEREGSADWQLMDQRPIPCEFTGHWNDLLTLAGDTIAAQCDGEDEIHLFQWNADANELIGKGVLSESFIHVADQLVGLDTGIIMVRGPSDFTVVNVSTEPYEIVWEGVSGQGNPSLHERTARLVGSRLWVPTGPDYSAGVFDIQAPFNSLPLLSLPAPGQTIDVRKGIAVQGHGDYHGFRVYDVSGCW